MAEIKQAKFIDQTGQEKDAVFIGAEKAIYDDSGKRLDQKLEEREKATGLLASDTQGILGNIGAEVSLQSIIDKVAEKIMRELVSNSSLTQTLANYMTTAMMSGEQINDGNKVPTSALAFAMNQAITQNKNAITQLNSDRFFVRLDYVPINSGYVQIADQRIKSGTKCVCTQIYEPRSEIISYAIIAQTQEGIANFYIRKGDGTFPEDEKTISIDALFSNRE